MRRARFVDPAGTVRVGDWTDDGIETAGRVYDPGVVDLLAPVDPGKVLGIGPNFVKPVEGDIPSNPAEMRLFWKGGRNVVAGPGDTVTLPESSAVIYEAELGVVVGEQSRNLDPAAAADVITGYTCVNDISNQDAAGEDTFLRRKSFDGAAPMGPVVAAPDRVPEEPRIQLWLNGERVQDSADDAFIWSPAEVVAELSRWVTLDPDDVITLGTTTGLGPLTGGDHVAIEIEGVGRLEHDVAAPP